MSTLERFVNLLASFPFARVKRKSYRPGAPILANETARLLLRAATSMWLSRDRT